MIMHYSYSFSHNTFFLSLTKTTVVLTVLKKYFFHQYRQHARTAMSQWNDNDVTSCDAKPHALIFKIADSVYF